MRASTFILCAPFSLVLACGGTTEQQPPPQPIDSGMEPDDAGTAPPDDATPVAPPGFPAFAIDAPQVANQGGPVLKTPKVTPIFFPGFDYATQLTDYTAKVGATSYWSAAVGEYGVGALQTNTPIVVPDADKPAATITDGDIQAWLTSMFDGTHPAFGSTPDPNTVYTLFYSPTTTIYDSGGPTGPDAGAPQGGQSCKSFGGYHNDVTINGQPIAYAVIPECKSFGGLVGADSITGTVSHELAEAVTDPYPADSPAYSQVDNNHIAWMSYLGGGEVGDMCAQFPGAFFKPADVGYYVQRIWSNKSAKAGNDPCQPSNAGEVYFNSAPVFPDKISARGGMIMTEGVLIPVGQSRTIELDLFSNAPTSGQWLVTAQGFARNGGASPLTFAFDKSKGQNGDKINLTITATMASTSSSKTATFVLTSGMGNQSVIWVGYVSIQ